MGMQGAGRWALQQGMQLAGRGHAAGKKKHQGRKKQLEKGYAARYHSITRYKKKYKKGEGQARALKGGRAALMVEEAAR